MRKIPFLIALSFTLAAFIHVTTCCASADTIKGVTNAASGPPKLVMVEQAHELLPQWYSSPPVKRAFVVVGSTFGLEKAKDSVVEYTLKGMEKGYWDSLMARDYPTPQEYPVNSANYMYYAFRAGLVKEIYWVPPSVGPVADEDIENFRGFIKAVGASDEEASRLTKDKVSFSGTVNGVPVHICRLKDLPKLEDEVTLVVDLSFFSELHQDEVKTPMLGIFQAFARDIEASGLKVYEADVAYSTAQGTVPLGERFVGEYLKVYFTAPGSLSEGPPEAWNLMAQSMYNDTFYQLEESAEYLDKGLRVDPKNAGLWYAMSVNQRSLTNLTYLKEALDKAVSLDKGYYTAYTSAGEYFIGEKVPDASQYFLQKAVEANPKDPGPYKALYTLHYAATNYRQAAESLQKVIDLGFKEGELYALLADSYQRAGEAKKAIDAYHEAIKGFPEVDRAARFTTLVGLAMAYSKDKQVENALKTYDEAIKYADNDDDANKVMENARKLKATWAPFLAPKAP